MLKENKYSAIIVAAGSGKRMNSSVPKQFMKIGGRTVLERAVQPFIEDEQAEHIVIVVAPEYVHSVENALTQDSRIQVTEGGAERQDSVYNALICLRKVGADLKKPVLIHDGARPYVTLQIIERVKEAAFEKDGAVCAVPLKDTVRHIEKGTLNRNSLRAVQTPQGFMLGRLIQAYQKAEEDGFRGTDDAGIMEHMGGSIIVVQGAYENIKITTPEDLKMSYRIGTGFDVHRLQEGRKLILGGVDIPFEKGLLGHSDADVLVHALMDSMLGAAALGDIGKLFPDTDDRYRGISSIKLLEQVKDRITEKGYTVVNTDITVVCQRPKLRPFIDEMRKNIAKAIAVDVDSVNIKATTTEKLGYTGRGEGISSEAVTLLSCYK